MQDGPSNSNYQITTTNQHDLHFLHPLAPSQQNPHSQQPLQHHLQPLLLGQPDVFSAVEAGSYISKGRRLVPAFLNTCFCCLHLCSWHSHGSSPPSRSELERNEDINYTPAWTNNNKDSEIGEPPLGVYRGKPRPPES